VTGTSATAASTLADQLRAQHPSTLAFEIMAGVPDVAADPPPRYHALRDVAPVHTMELPMMGVIHVLSRYADCKAVLASHEFGKGERDRARGLLEDDDEAAQYAELQSRTRPMLFLNPPDHTRIRGLVSRAFTPRRIDALRPTIERMVADVLDPIAGGGEVDLLDVLAFPLPVAVIGALVGVPAEDHDWFRTRVRDGAATLELSADAGVLRRGAVALAEMGEYFVDLIEVRKADPQDDLLSALIAAEDDGDRLTRDELISNVILLFAAGFETTTNLIGNGTVALTQHPDQLRRLRDDRRLLPGAVEEVLRYDSPVQLDARTALVDTTLPDGTAVAAGETAVTLLGAANRDPARFADPDRFDVERADNAPLSFAWGIHHCIGAGLARAEGAVAFGALLDRFDGIEVLDDPPRWRPGLTLRGLERLPVRLT
jgi:cytochrome P450